MLQIVALFLVAPLLLLTSCASAPSRAYQEAVDRETTSAKPAREPERPATAIPIKKPEPPKPHADFTEEGVAGWVGKGAAVRTTASGELYDPYALTASHRTLPFGIYVSVKNLETGEEIVARINDRGPYVRYRILDLSLAAAQQLRIGSGAKVHIHALGFRKQGNPGAYQEPDGYDRGNYSVQVGSFRDERSARQLVDRLRKLFSPVESRKGIENGVMVHQVLVGRYSSLKTAEEAEHKFGAHGYPQCFVISLD